MTEPAGAGRGEDVDGRIDGIRVAEAEVRHFAGHRRAAPVDAALGRCGGLDIPYASAAE